MIKGVGNDIIEISRIRNSIERFGAHFLDRLFTPAEQAYCNKHKDPAPHFAGRFAAKEAIAKALGYGFGAEISWCALEILNDPQGKPILQPSTTIDTRFNNPQIQLSISHSTDYATAIAIWS